MTNIRDKVFENYHTDTWEWLPDVICLGCHRAVFNAAANNAAGQTVSHIDYSKVRAPATMSARATTVESREHGCKCSICWIGRMDMLQYREFEKQMKEPVGRPRLYPEDEDPEPIKICSKCRGEYGRGKPHNNCNATGKRQNVIAVINEGEEVEREQILAQQLRSVMAAKGETSSMGVPTGGVVTIATTGRVGQLEVAAAPSGLQKPKVRFTHEAIMRCQLKMGSTDRGTLQMARFLRIHEGRESIEPGLAEALIERNTRYEHFFDQKKITFTEYYTPEGDEEEEEGDDGRKKKKKKKETREVTRPMAFCTDVDGLAAEVMTQRGLDPARVTIQIGIDDGEAKYHAL